MHDVHLRHCVRGDKPTRAGSRDNRAAQSSDSKARTTIDRSEKRTRSITQGSIVGVGTARWEIWRGTPHASVLYVDWGPMMLERPERSRKRPSSTSSHPPSERWAWAGVTVPAKLSREETGDRIASYARDHGSELVTWDADRSTAKSGSAGQVSHDPTVATRVAGAAGCLARLRERQTISDASARWRHEGIRPLMGQPFFRSGANGRLLVQ
jgi:hypothetical protein